MKKILILWLIASSLFAAIPSKPTLVLPIVNKTEVAISSTLFKWNTSTGIPTSYHIQISQISTFGYFAINDSTLIDTTKTVTTLIANTKYFWRVRAKNGDGTSAWSDVRSFTTIITLPTNPKLTAGNGTNEKFFRVGISAPYFSWHSTQNRYFYIDSSGTPHDTLWWEDFDLSKDHIATGKWTFRNVTTFDSTMVLDSAQYFGSKEYVSGWAGSGWKLDYGLTDTGKATLAIDNLSVRGSLSVYELLVRQIRASNGNIFVTSGAKVNTVGAGGGGKQWVLLEDPNNTHVSPFAVGDLIKAQRYDLNGTTLIHNVEATIDSIDVAIGNRILVSFYTLGSPPGFQNGEEIVRVGNTTNTSRQSSIYLAADDANSPFMDMITGVNSWSAWGSAAKTKLRIGNLAGITDADFGGALSGYGAYMQNAYIKGNIKMTDGSISWANVTKPTYDASEVGAMSLNPASPTVIGNNWIYSRYITASQLIADSMKSGIITALTYQTDSGTAGHYKRAVLSASTNDLNFYSSTNQLLTYMTADYGFGYLQLRDPSVATAYAEYKPYGAQIVNSNYGSINLMMDLGLQFYNLSSTKMFEVNSAGRLTTVNGAQAPSYTGYGLVSDGTSYTPTAMAIGNWNTAYGWGNHASAGYLTSISGLNISSLTNDSNYIGLGYIDAHHVTIQYKDWSGANQSVDVVLNY